MRRCCTAKRVRVPYDNNAAIVITLMVIIRIINDVNDGERRKRRVIITAGATKDAQITAITEFRRYVSVRVYA